MIEQPFILENNIATRNQIRGKAGEVKNTDGLYKVNLSLVRIRPEFNPRTLTRPPGMLDELWEQILHIPLLADQIFENCGPIDPILGDFWREDGNFYVTEGERRTRALNHLIRTEREYYPNGEPVNIVKVLLNPPGTTDKHRELIALNAGNKMTLSPLQRAYAYKRHKDKYQLSNEEVGKEAGNISRQTVDNYLMLLELPTETQEKVDCGELSINIALDEYRKSKKPTGTQVLVDGDTGEVIEKGPDAGKKPEAPKEQSGDEGEFEQQDNSVTFPGGKGGPKEEGSGAHALGTDSIHLREQKKAGWRNLFHRIEHHKGALVKSFMENEAAAEDKLIERLMNEFDLTAK